MESLENMGTPDYEKNGNHSGADSRFFKIVDAFGNSLRYRI